MTKTPAILKNPVHERIRQAFAGAHAGRIARITSDDPERLVYEVTLVKPLPDKASLDNHGVTVTTLPADRLNLTIRIAPKLLAEALAKADPLETEELPAVKIETPDETTLSFDEQFLLRTLFNKWEQSLRGWVRLTGMSQVRALENPALVFTRLAERGLIEYLSATHQARITRTGCAAIHVQYPPDALGQSDDPMVEALEALSRLDPDKDREQYVETLRTLWRTVDPATLPGDDLTRMKQERDLALSSVELLTAARVALQNEVDRLRAVNERQSEMLKQAAAAAAEEWDTLHQEIHSPDGWANANRDLMQKRREGWDVVQIDTEVFPSGNGRPYMTLRFVTLKRAAPPAPQPEPEQREKMVERAEPLPSYRVGNGARVVMPEPLGDPARNHLRAALEQPLVKAIREKGVEGVLAEWDEENRQTFMDVLAQHAPKETRFTLIPGRPETAVEALPPLLTP